MLRLIRRRIQTMIIMGDEMKSRILNAVVSRYVMEDSIYYLKREEMS